MDCDSLAHWPWILPNVSVLTFLMCKIRMIVIIPYKVFTMARWHKVSKYLEQHLPRFWPKMYPVIGTSLFYFCFSEDKFAHSFRYLWTIFIHFYELLMSIFFFIFLEVCGFLICIHLPILDTLFMAYVCIYPCTYIKMT